MMQLDDIVQLYKSTSYVSPYFIFL
uniref:Uncharacterized protein n=1 Tax=Arundo donax TaxID=35708 RepID=A0A0A9C5C8_ARUDO